MQARKMQAPRKSKLAVPSNFKDFEKTKPVSKTSKPVGLARPGNSKPNSEATKSRTSVPMSKTRSDHRNRVHEIDLDLEENDFCSDLSLSRLGTVSASGTSTGSGTASGSGTSSQSRPSSSLYVGDSDTEDDLAESVAALKVTNEIYSLPSTSTAQVKKYKNGTRTSMTFTNERMREIERHNAILLRKILDRKKVAIPRPAAKSKMVKPSAAVARERQRIQKQIALENALLDKRLQAAKSVTKTRHTFPH